MKLTLGTTRQTVAGTASPDRVHLKLATGAQTIRLATAGPDYAIAAQHVTTAVAAKEAAETARDAAIAAQNAVVAMGDIIYLVDGGSAGSTYQAVDNIDGGDANG